MAKEIEKLNNPWMIAVWPGMGNVAMLAGSHLAAALEADIAMELRADDFFEVKHVDVEDGLASTGNLPRNLFLIWRDPAQRRDLVIFIGEAQPARGGYFLCRRIVEQAKRWNVQRIVTFAAMATQLHPAREAGVFAVANNRQLVEECRDLDLTLLKQGQITGLNGIMLAAADEENIPALCLMGEMPYFAVNVPNAQSALAALDAFTEMAGIDPDLEELEAQAEQVQAQLRELVERLGQPGADPEEEDLGFTIPDVAKQPDQREDDQEPKNQPKLDPEARQRIESLFEQVEQDHSRAVELKNELDRHGVFDQYEDRFLDLFRKGG